MKKVSFDSLITNGKLEREVAEKISSSLSSFNDKRVTITIEPFVKHKTNKQSAMLFGLIYPHYLTAMIDFGDDSFRLYGDKNRIAKATDCIHEMLLSEFAGRDQVNIGTGEIIFVPSRSSAMTTIELSVYVECIIRACADRYGYPIPTPKQSDYE